MCKLTKYAYIMIIQTHSLQFIHFVLIFPSVIYSVVFCTFKLFLGLLTLYLDLNTKCNNYQILNMLIRSILNVLINKVCKSLFNLWITLVVYAYEY